MSRFDRIARNRLTVAVVAGAVGAGAALWIAKAGDWRDVVLVLVTGLLTIVAAELSSDREANRQRVLREEERGWQREERAATATRELRLARLHRTRDVVLRMIEVSLLAVAGKRERAADMFKTIDPVGDMIGIDVGLIGNADARNAYEQAVMYIHQTPVPPAAVPTIIGAKAMVLVAFADQEDRIAAGDEPLRAPDPPNLSDQVATLMAKIDREPD